MSVLPPSQQRRLSQAGYTVALNGNERETSGLLAQLQHQELVLCSVLLDTLQPTAKLDHLAEALGVGARGTELVPHLLLLDEGQHDGDGRVGQGLITGEPALDDLDGFREMVE